jgi:hypothetical protein
MTSDDADQQTPSGAEEAPPASPADEAEGAEPLTLFQLLGSALAAAFGVQSSRNRARDFSRGRPLHFIIIGVVLTALFVLAVVGVVNLVLSSAG